MSHKLTQVASAVASVFEPLTPQTAKRKIGISHRLKFRKEADVVVEARPTMICIAADGKEAVFKLETETDELDFLLGRFPVKWKKLGDGEEVPEGVLPHHVVRKEPKEDGGKEIVSIPTEYDGFRSGDLALAFLGGSGDYFAYALSNKGKDIGASVARIPAFRLKAICEEAGISRAKRKEKGEEGVMVEINSDHEAIIKVASRAFSDFYPCEARDRDLIRLRALYNDRNEVMKARMACGQRIFQRAVGAVFMSPEGKYPEGRVEDMIEAKRANDAVFQALVIEEEARKKELKRAVESLPVWELFKPITGVGPSIASGLIVAIGDIRRFGSAPKLKSFLGVHVLNSEGKKMGVGERPEAGKCRFVRRRTGQVANWHPQGRQALYLLGDQFNRRPGSVWGKKLLENKAKFQAQYPEPIKVDGKLRYTKAHIHKMALWRTLTQFVEWLYGEWTDMERKARAPKGDPKLESPASSASSDEASDGNVVALFRKAA